MKKLLLLLSLSLMIGETFAKDTETLTPADVLASSSSQDWRTINQSDLLYLSLVNGVVIFELAADFAPNHLKNLRSLVENEYFDGLAIIRSQDNYVAQWGDPNAETDKFKSIGKALAKLEPEFFRELTGLDVQMIDSRDPYAEKVGFSNGFTVGADQNRAWLTHCYGALGVGRGMAADSGNAAELYVVTGHAPRHLDRNVTLIGRALVGMELLSSLPRGSGNMGFYESAAETTVIKSIRFGDQLTKEQQRNFSVLRTDTTTFKNHVKSRTFRTHEWFIDSAGKIEICNVGVPVREEN